MPLFKHSPSLGELEEETERKRAEDDLIGTELSIAQKRVAIAELKKRGLSAKHFGFDFKRIIQWLKTH